MKLLKCFSQIISEKGKITELFEHVSDYSLFYLNRRYGLFALGVEDANVPSIDGNQEKLTPKKLIKKRAHMSQTNHIIIQKIP